MSVSAAADFAVDAAAAGGVRFVSVAVVCRLPRSYHACQHLILQTVCQPVAFQ